MATWRELPEESGGFTVDVNGVDLVKQFFLEGLADEGDVELFAFKNSPPVFRRLVRQSVKAKRRGPAEWFVDVAYSNRLTDQQDPGTDQQPDASKFGSAFSFDTTGQTAHITQSLATVSKTNERGTDLGNAGNNFTLDNARAIGISQESVAGCDKYLPQFQWQMEHTLAVSDGQYLVTLMNLTGAVNAQTFCGFPPRSTLFLGASGRFTFDERWRITFKFSSLPNRVNIRISDKITVPVKAGWDYLWVGYLPQQVGNKILQVPNAAYVEQIYEASDFFLLGVGGCVPLAPGNNRDAVKVAAAEWLGGLGFGAKARPNMKADGGLWGNGVLRVNDDGTVTDIGVGRK